MYDLEVRTRVTRLTGTNFPEAEEVRKLVGDSLAAGGYPVPAEVQDPDAFAARLAEDGEYRYATQDVEIAVKRSG